MGKVSNIFPTLDPRCASGLTLGHKTWLRNRNPLPAKMSCPQKPLLPVFNQFKERFNAPKSNIFIFQLNSFQLKRKKLMCLMLMMMGCWNGK